MKIQIRRGVFETNSSSVHTLTIVSIDDFERWKNGELYYYRDNNDLITKDEAIEIINNEKKYCEEHNYEFDNEEYSLESTDCNKMFLTYDEFNDWDYINFEIFKHMYKTKSGEEIVAFGYYGHD